jgi:nucleoside-diphosphate-sugar epimerase
MLILFDNGTPAPLRYALKDHIVVEAMERGWDRLVNGELIAAAEAAGFEVLLTTDKNMRYQQNLKDRKIAFVVLGNQQWPTLRRYVERVVAVVNAALRAATPRWTYRLSKAASPPSPNITGCGACSRPV